MRDDETRKRLDQKEQKRAKKENIEKWENMRKRTETEKKGMPLFPLFFLLSLSAQAVCRSAGRERGTIEKESKQSHDIICPPKIEEVWEIHFIPIFYLRHDLFSCVNSYQIYRRYCFWDHPRKLGQLWDAAYKEAIWVIFMEYVAFSSCLCAKSLVLIAIVLDYFCFSRK